MKDKVWAFFIKAPIRFFTAETISRICKIDERQVVKALDQLVKDGDILKEGDRYIYNIHN